MGVCIQAFTEEFFAEWEWTGPHREAFAEECRRAIAAIKPAPLGLKRWFSYAEVEVQIIKVEGYGTFPVCFYAELPCEDDIVPAEMIQTVGAWLLVTLREVIDDSLHLPFGKPYGVVFLPNRKGKVITVNKAAYSLAT